MKRLYLNLGSPPPTHATAIAGLGVSEPMEPSIIDRPGGNGWYLLMHFDDPAEVFSLGEMHKIPAGTTMLWNPGMRHTYGNPHSPWRHSWLSMHGSMVQEAIASAQLPIDSPLQLDAGQVIAHYIELLYEEVISHSSADHLILEGLVQLLMRDLSRRFRERGGPPALPEVISQLRRFIEDHLANELYLNVLADRAGMSVPHLCAVFRKHMGMAPRQYVEQQRMHRAAHLLTNQTLTIAEIAKQVGYDDPLYFSKRFRKSFGLCPKRYRT